MSLDNNNTLEVNINVESDIVRIRKAVRQHTKELGFGVTDETRLVTAASELARNIYRYANTGCMRIRKIINGGKIGIELLFEDEGPGIDNVEQAMAEGYSTSRSLGLGLPGTRRLIDEMGIESEAGHGTKITIIKWKK